MQNAGKKGIVDEQPQSSSTIFSPNSAQSSDTVAVVEDHHKKANLAVLAALHAMKADTPIAFAVLDECDHIFLMRTPTRPPHLAGNILRAPGLKVYEVINQTGHRMYFAVVIPKQCFYACWICPNSFIALIVDSFGDEIFKIEADSGFYGNRSVVIAKNGSEIFGKIQQGADCCTPDYSLTNSNDDPIFKIRPSQSVNCFNCCVPVDYVIYHGELATQIGRMNTNWYNTGVLPQLFHSPHIKLYGVQFPIDIDITSKVLLLSTLLMTKIFRNEF